MQPREQMSSGGKGGNGGMRAAEERKGQDMHREKQGEQTATRPLGVCLLWADVTPGQVIGLGKQRAGWKSASLTSCSEQPAQQYEGSEGEAAKKAEWAHSENWEQNQEI